MHKKFINILVCPSTGQSLSLEAEKRNNDFVYSGYLISQDKKNKYPIIKGVPCFVESDNYSSSFGYEWQNWPRVQFEEENINRPMEGHTTKMFKAITDFDEKDLNNKLIIEYGCGPGRFIDVAHKMGAIVVGLDMSQAVYVARDNFKENENILIVHADLMHPPFKKSMFDFAYTIGTLHHTPNPETGLKSLIKLVKPNGKIAVSVYTMKGFYNYPSVYIYRKINSLLARIIGEMAANCLAKCYSYFSSTFFYYPVQIINKIPKFGNFLVTVINKYLLVFLLLPDIRWRILDVFDAITPRYASTHTPEEIKTWFKEADVSDVKQTNWADTSFVGIKK